MEQFLLWYEGLSTRGRRLLFAGIGALVFAGGYFLLVGPKWEQAGAVAAEADSLEAQIQDYRRRLARTDQSPESLEAQWQKVRASLAADTAGGTVYRSASELVTALTRSAEEAGGEDPIFNPVSDRSLGPVAPWLRVSTVEGQFTAGTRTVADFFDQLQDLEGLILVDSLLVARRTDRLRTVVRVHALSPATGS